MKSSKLNRRQFLGSAAALGAATTVGTIGAGALSSCAGGEQKAKYTPLRPASEVYIPSLTDKAIEGKALKAGLIGCGGRGTGAAMDFLSAANGVSVVAIGDVMPHRVESARKKLKEEKGVELADDKCFVGFDAYKKVIDSDVDMVLIATPPGFRPEHARYAVEQGKHAFLEKPLAVDPVGCKTMFAVARQAQQKGLSIVTGTQRHHQRSYLEAYQKIQEGIIGPITGGNVYWSQPKLWFVEKEAGWTDMEWMIRGWVDWRWLSGDHIVEQHVHNIDVFNWFIGQHPIKCVGFGSRQRRKIGDQYDNFSVDFIYENGVHAHSMCRQIDGCANNVSEEIYGSLGYFKSYDDDNDGKMTIRDLNGKVVWAYDEKAEKQKFEQNNPYVLEHVNLITCIRNNTPICQIEETTNSTLSAIMGRESAYTGQEVTWEGIMASSQSIVPSELQMRDYPEIAKNVVIPVPGSASADS